MCHVVILRFLLHCVKIADSIVYMYIVLVNIHRFVLVWSFNQFSFGSELVVLLVLVAG